MARTSASENLIVIPARLTMKMSSCPVVTITATSSSPSRKLSAIKPSRRLLSYSEKGRLLHVTLLVAKNKYLSEWNSRVSISACMRSPGASGRRLTMAVPRAVRS